MSFYFYIPPPYPFPDQWNQQKSIQTSGLWLTPYTHFTGVNSMNISEIPEKKEDCDTWNETDYERSTVCKWMNTIDLVVDDFG